MNIEVIDYTCLTRDYPILYLRKSHLKNIHPLQYTDHYNQTHFFPRLPCCPQSTPLIRQKNRKCLSSDSSRRPSVRAVARTSEMTSAPVAAQRKEYSARLNRRYSLPRRGARKRGRVPRHKVETCMERGIRFSWRRARSISDCRPSGRRTRSVR